MKFHNSSSEMETTVTSVLLSHFDDIGLAVQGLFQKAGLTNSELPNSEMK